jgi:hypothetical protein
VFGKRYRSKKVDLTCPYCGHLQQEPSQVISSFCRSCGEHFRVRKGVAIANPGLRVSGIAEVRPPRKRNPLLTAPEPSGTPAPAGNSWLVSAEAQEEGARPLPEPAPRSDGDGEELTAGAFFGLGAPVTTPESLENTGPSLGRNAQSREALAEGSLGALIAAQQTVVVAEKDKMPPNYAAPDDRRRRDDNVPEIRVRCFRCHHHQDVSPNRRSASVAAPTSAWRITKSRR